MSPPGKLDPPGLANPTEFTVDVTWKGTAGAQKYKLYRRKIPEEWSDSAFTLLDGALEKFTLEDLEPTSTYQFRIAAVNSAGEEGEKSEPVTIDTAVGNCGPKKKKCVIS